MRYATRDLSFAVRTADDGGRPIRMQIGGLVYTLHPPEALALANKLVDAVEKLEAKERQQHE